MCVLDIYLENDSVVIFSLKEDHPIMSFTLNDNGRLALLNVATQVIVIFNTIIALSFKFFISLGNNCIQCPFDLLGTFYGNTAYY